ncbi:MAG: efflux RND transporter periplasmic adaptor subunit [Pseudomonadota bacterium]
MNKISKQSTTITILLILISLVACKPDNSQPKAITPKLVKTLVVTDANTSQYRSYPAKVSASQKVNLSFEVPGRLIELPAKEGKEFKKGELLAKLDPRDYQIQVDKELAKYEHARITYERYKILLPSNAVSRAQYDEKRSMALLAKANLEDAEKSLKDTELYAPFSGIVAKRYVENYQYVQARQKILSLQDISDIEIIINIPEQDISRADDIESLSEGKKTGQVVGVATFPALPGREFPVRVKEVKTEADINTQTYQVTLIMPLPEKSIILPGMTAAVKIKFGKSKETSFNIPIEAVSTDAQGKQFVWLVDPKTSRVKKQMIELGQATGNTVVVEKGLENGDRIVVAGVAYLEPNMAVKVLQGKIGTQ